MNPPNYQVRRATLDDLGRLRPLWEAMRLPIADLEKRLTEFQVAESADGQLVGTVGFQINGRAGRIHSEAFLDFALADSVRPLFWDRIHALALNHGVARLWTQEHAPFWSRNGLQPAGPEALKKLPAAWGDPNAGWLTSQLKDEDALVSAEKELAMFIQAEKQRTARIFEQVRVLKFIATIIGIALAVFILAAVVYMARKNPALFTPRR